jgi:hypothetical protein
VFYSLAYESQASVPLTAPDLLDLLGQSRENNAQSGVTGILLYRHGTFLQVLEGPHAAVDALYATIARDPRHRDVSTVLVEDRVEELYATIARDSRHHAVSTVLAEDRSARRFPDWTMGFADVAGELGDVDGFNDVLTTVQGPDGQESEKFLELLALFASED